MTTRKKIAIAATTVATATALWLTRDSFVPNPTPSLHWDHNGQNLTGFTVWTKTNLADPWTPIANLGPDARSFPISPTNAQQFFTVSAK